MANRKLMVEVCNAKNLMPKDGQGTASAYVIVDFDGQRRRTKTISRDLNPQWDEKIEFLVHDVASMATDILELNVYNDNKKTGKRSTFLGKVKVAGSTFPKCGSEALVYYPLEKRSVFSQIKGEIGIKICYEDEEPPPAPAAEEPKVEAAETPPAATEEKPPEDKKPDEETKGEEKPAEGGEKKEEKPPEDQKKEDTAAAAPATPSADAAAAAVAPPPPPVEIIAVAQSPKPKQSEENLQLARKPSNLDSDVASLSKHHRGNTTFDLVDRMPFLYVRVLKAKRETKDSDDSTAYYAKLVIGTYSINTKAQGTTKDWDQVFAFDKEGLNSTSLEVSVFDRKKKVLEDGKEEVSESCLGTVTFDLPEVPKRVPPDSPLAPQWYTLEGSPENTPATDVMLAVWLGTQADEAFQEAWQSDSGGLIPETRAKVYLSPKLWYLRLTVIQTQDLQLGLGAEPRVKNPELFVKAQLGPQLFKTNRTMVGSSSTSSNPTWNEDLVFVAAEPFEPFLVITVEDASNGQTVGHARVHVGSIDKRTDDRSTLGSRWFNLVGDENRPYAGRIHVGVCLEGGYHVLDEAAHVTSDVRPTAKQLSKPPIGLLEVGIRGATNLLPVKTKDGTRGTTDSYVVAKYGPKWVRTRTILDRFNPRWNEQYTWDVYDPCTVLTIGVFDNGRYRAGEGDNKPSKDVRLGKLRVRLSTLDTNRVYVGSYSLIVLLPGGAKKMGEIEIAVRFSCSSWISLIQAYSTPMLPRMHYVRPLGPMQQDMLRHNAMKIVTARLARSEPALGQEVVQFMLDSDTHTWSMRRSKSNWFRIVGCLSKAATLARWLDSIRTWVHPPTTVLVHVLLLAIVLCPHLILPTICLYAFLIVALRYRYRMRIPVTMDPRLSQVDSVGPDELDEEFDGFPSSRSPDHIRVRYDRLRALAGRAQTLLGDVAAQGERLEALCNWRDPRATGIFVVVCLLASLVFYVVPFKAFLLGWGFFYMRHPRFRGDMPSLPINFFRRLPPLSDQIL
ncbi:protein QUIRKY [Cynara cardunculus var. scolymus]|uniref:C2 calcium-dependent membrane targeting n=1 Tax=Cynara cardunculus var. scolymus TaxID=59895 RepID=A0A103XSC9_CYNCS|nr:protein QUIRKY [Cynara cardunculus var. scolymus]KVH95974.1 C2 calcium-dependent membrane targeting [Cynara cardunculus var. scolymus]